MTTPDPSDPVAPVAPDGTPAPLVDGGAPIPLEASPTAGIAPGLPRLDRPRGTSKAIPDFGTGAHSPVFLVVVSVASFVADVGSKLWAEKKLEGYPGYVTLLENHLQLILAKNKGGAWGLLQGQNEAVRRPFFLVVSVLAILFIVTLYRKLTLRQRALKWGLPLVLGGALGNVFDRIRYGYVIDFIDYRADWIKKGNDLLAKSVKNHVVTDHWPTFNVADIAICIGVALMAIDMFTAKRGVKERTVDPLASGVDAQIAASEAPVVALGTEPAPSDPPADGEKANPAGSPPPRAEAPVP